MLGRLADRLILWSSTHPISADEKVRRTLPLDGGVLELFMQHTQPARESELLILKYLGTGGRAERSTLHPADAWPDTPCEIHSLNPPGYGGSSGPASMKKMARAALAAFDDVAERAAGRPVIVTGNSLGVISALHVAARRACAGLVLRNGPPLRELIIARFGWWNLSLGARLIAGQVPADLCSRDNARACTAPAVFISCQKDRVVPPVQQQLIIDAYAGPKHTVLFAEADHIQPGNASEMQQYAAALVWLKQQAAPAAVAR